MEDVDVVVINVNTVVNVVVVYRDLNGDGS